MSIIQYILITYCGLSILSLLNKEVRHLYIEALDDLYKRVLALKKSFKGSLTDYLFLPLNCLVEIMFLILTFIIAPIVAVLHLLMGRFKLRHTITKPTPPIKQEYLIPPLIIKVRKNISFAPDEQQVIYFEDCFNEVLNDYISKKYEDIYSLFKEKGYNFIYIPKLIENIGVEEAKYLSPALNEESAIPNKLTAQNLNDKFLSFTDVTTSLSGGLLRYKEEEEDYYIFTYYQFINLDELEIWEQIRTYLSAVGDNTLLYSVSPHIPNIEPEENADYDFDSDSKQLIAEIKERVELLKQKGINEMVLKSLFSFDTVELSKLVISNEYKIFLSDYNNLEITMHPLPKAVFFLFLNHPEGILFKNLPDYRDELIAIYKMVSGRENIDDMAKSINDVVNPTLNSINEKCSRIREAFVKHFEESIAQNYYITGERATPKKIALNRKLIILDKINFNIEVVKTPFEYTKHIKYKSDGTDDLPF